MNTIRTTLLTAMLVVLPLAGACSKQEPPAEAASAASETKGLIARAVEKEIAKARKELTEGNISIGGDGISIKVNGKHYSGKDNLPKAEITPQGELLIEGKPVATTPEQRALLLEYRGQVIGIAETGMVIGAKAADMAGAAITESLGAIFSGNTDAIEKKVEAEAEKIKSEAIEICRQLPAMLETQQRLSASLPEFAPYANMDQSDIDDCVEDIAEES
jgi:hypothetical protein